jgi:hypothetical protein
MDAKNCRSGAASRFFMSSKSVPQSRLDGRPNNGQSFPKNAECLNGFRPKRSFTKARLAAIKTGLTMKITMNDREAIYG